MDSLDPNTLFSLNGKTALVTGGSRGIGRMMAQGLLQAGAGRVYITARKGEECRQAAEDLSVYGECIAIASDVAKPQARAELVAKLAEGDGGLHVLINNAGTSWGAAFDEYPDEAFSKIFDVNVAALFALTRDLAPLLRKAASPEDPARVVNLGSMEGEHVPTNAEAPTFAYSASKAAVHHLTRTLAVQLAADSITVNAIAPGFYPSKMTAVLMDERMEHIVGNCPLGRMGRPEEMAGAAVYLCSRAGAFTTGATLVIDGGTSIYHHHQG